MKQPPFPKHCNIKARHGGLTACHTERPQTSPDLLGGTPESIAGATERHAVSDRRDLALLLSRSAFRSGFLGSGRFLQRDSLLSPISLPVLYSHFPRCGFCRSFGSLPSPSPFFAVTFFAVTSSKQQQFLGRDGLFVRPRLTYFRCADRFDALIIRNEVRSFADRARPAPDHDHSK